MAVKYSASAVWGFDGQGLTILLPDRLEQLGKQLASLRLLRLGGPEAAGPRFDGALSNLSVYIEISVYSQIVVSSVRFWA